HDPLNATTIKAAHTRELRTRATSGAGNSSSGGSSSGLKYVLPDLQGTTRAVMNNNGNSSMIVARHDYLPFGEEIGSGVGLRSGGQGYAATDNSRQNKAFRIRPSRGQAFDSSILLDDLAARRIECRAHGQEGTH